MRGKRKGTGERKRWEKNKEEVWRKENLNFKIQIETFFFYKVVDAKRINYKLKKKPKRKGDIKP